MDPLNPVAPASLPLETAPVVNPAPAAPAPNAAPAAAPVANPTDAHFQTRYQDFVEFTKAKGLGDIVDEFRSTYRYDGGGNPTPAPINAPAPNPMYAPAPADPYADATFAELPADVAIERLARVAEERAQKSYQQMRQAERDEMNAQAVAAEAYKINATVDSWIADQKIPLDVVKQAFDRTISYGINQRVPGGPTKFVDAFTTVLASMLQRQATSTPQPNVQQQIADNVQNALIIQQPAMGHVRQPAGVTPAQSAADAIAPDNAPYVYVP